VNNEYLLKADDGEPLIVGVSALRPPDYRLEPIQGWGDYRMRCGPGEIAFSFEEFGIQMVIDGPQSDFDDDRLAEALRASVEAATGRKISLVCL
jgi:hypothetical protein